MSTELVIEKNNAKVYLKKIIQEHFKEKQECVSDINMQIILVELALFGLYSEYVDIEELKICANRIYVRVCKRNDKSKSCFIQIRGDNLVTRKKMDKVIRGKRRSDCKNNDDFFSYIFFPFEAAKGSINTKRASCSGYNDNLFVFFETLKQMYEVDFQCDDHGDKLKKCICEYKDFWELFGTRINGYEHYLDTFCLRCIEELREDNLEFYSKMVYSREWRNKNVESLGIIFEKYNALLECFHNIRKNEMCNRIKDNNICSLNL